MFTLKNFSCLKELENVEEVWPNLHLQALEEPWEEEESWTNSSENEFRTYLENDERKHLKTMYIQNYEIFFIYLFKRLFYLFWNQFNINFWNTSHLLPTFIENKLQKGLWIYDIVYLIPYAWLHKTIFTIHTCLLLELLSIVAIKQNRYKWKIEMNLRQNFYHLFQRKWFAMNAFAI